MAPPIVPLSRRAAEQRRRNPSARRRAPGRSSSSSASISASGVPALADSTSSSGSYSVTPESAGEIERHIGLARPADGALGALPGDFERLVVAERPVHGVLDVLGVAGLQRVGHLEPRNVGERQLAAGNVHAAELGAAVQLGKDLAGIEQALFVEGAFDALLLRRDRSRRTSPASGRASRRRRRARRSARRRPRRRA